MSLPLRPVAFALLAYAAAVGEGGGRAGASLLRGSPEAGAAELAPWPDGPTPFGMGGGGALFQPAISPHDARLLFVQCDMKGVYRSADGGASWRLLDGRQIGSVVCEGCPPAAFTFDPRDARTLYAFGTHAGRDGLLVSRDLGDTWSALFASPPWGGATVTALALDPDAPERLLVGTTEGAYLKAAEGTTFRVVELPGRAHASVLGVHIGPAASGKPRPLWVATPEGVARSDDAGVRWVEASRGLPTAAIRRFGAATNVASGRTVLYATVPSEVPPGRGALEGGVFRSEDGGLAWERAMGEGINVRPERVDPYGLDDIPQYGFVETTAAAPEVAYVTTRGNGLYPPYDFTVWKTSDAGRSYRETLFGNPVLPEKRGLDVNVAAGWLTWDYGWYWGGDAYGLTVSARDAAHAIYTNLGELLETRDGGRSWRQLYTESLPAHAPAGPAMRWRSRGIDVTTSWHHAVDPFHPRVRFVAHSDIGLTRSDDGGRTWRHAVLGAAWTNSFYDLAFDPAVPGRMWAAASRQHDIPHWTQLEGPSARSSGGVLYSDDGGATWLSRSEGLPDAPAVSLALDPTSSERARRLWVSVFGHGVFRSDDGGRTWAPRSDGLGTPANRNAYAVRRHASGVLDVIVTGKRVGKVMAGGSGVYRSRDSGDHWAPITDPASVPDAWLSDFAVNPTDARVVYVAASDAPSAGGIVEGGMYRTSDGGATWQKLPLPRPAREHEREPLEIFAPSLHPRDPRIVFATTNGNGTWVSHDEGATWDELALPFLSTHRVDVDPEDPDVLFVSTFGGGTWRLRHAFAR